MGLTASVSASDRAGGAGIEVTIENAGSEPVTLTTATFAPSLAFEVTDQAGTPVPLGPPPVPPSDLAAGAATIDAGGSLALSYSLAELLPGGAGPGRYRLRFAADVPAIEGGWSGRITSDWVTLTVA